MLKDEIPQPELRSAELKRLDVLLVYWLEQRVYFHFTLTQTFHE